MAGAHGHTCLAVGLEAAYARPMAGARIDNDEWTFLHIDDKFRRRFDPCQQVVGRAIKMTGIENEFSIKMQHVRNLHFMLFLEIPGSLS